MSIEERNNPYDEAICELEALSEMVDEAPKLERAVEENCRRMRNLTISQNLSKARTLLIFTENKISKYIQTIIANSYLSVEDLQMYESNLFYLWGLTDERITQIEKLEAQVE